MDVALVTAQYVAALRSLVEALDEEIPRVEELREEYSSSPIGTVVILTAVAPLNAAKKARAATDVDAMRAAFDALREIE